MAKTSGSVSLALFLGGQQCFVCLFVCLFAWFVVRKWNFDYVKSWNVYFPYLSQMERLLLENKMPIIVGGTNYYIEALLWNFLIDKQVLSVCLVSLSVSLSVIIVSNPVCLSVCPSNPLEVSFTSSLIVGQNIHMTECHDVRHRLVVWQKDQIDIPRNFRHTF